MEKVLGIDIGGTSIKAGLFSREGVLEGVTRIPTGKIVGEEAFSRVVRSLLELLRANGVSPNDVVGVGLDVPGPVDASGRVGMLPNLEIDVERLKVSLQDAFPYATLAFANDANAAALGELWRGAAEGAPSFVFVALGTGVGGGVVIDGKLVPGAFGVGGEMGHLTVRDDEQEPCGCGRCGCLEQYASASGVVCTYLKECAGRGIDPVALSSPSDTIAVFRACRAGDEAAKAAISLMCDRLGFALAQVSAVIDPALYLIGGGMGEGFELYADELRSAFRAYSMVTCADARIEPASLGNKAAMYGSAFLALRALKGCIRKEP